METFKHPKYTYLKGNIYYFSKAVPDDLRSYYKKPRIIQSLRTKSSSQARMASKMLANKLEEYWLGLRLKQIEVPAPHLLLDREISSIECENVPTIDDAKELYLEVKGATKDHVFKRNTERNIAYLKTSIGARHLSQYTTADAAEFRQWLLQKKLSSGSLKRIFGNIKDIQAS